MPKTNAKYEKFTNILEIEGINAQGFGTIAKMAMLDQRLTIEAKAIYSYFCSYAGGGSTAFPSVSKIVYDLKISKDRYYKHFKLLVELGYISVRENKDNGKFANNIYRIMSNPVPCTENKEMDSPCPENPDKENSDKESQDTNINNININNFNNVLDDVEKPMTYLKAVIKDYMKNNISTVKEAIEYDKVFKEKKNKSNKKNNSDRKQKLEELRQSATGPILDGYYDWMKE